MPDVRWAAQDHGTAPGGDSVWVSGRCGTRAEGSRGPAWVRGDGATGHTNARSRRAAGRRGRPLSARVGPLQPAGTQRSAARSVATRSNGSRTADLDQDTVGPKVPGRAERYVAGRRSQNGPPITTHCDRYGPTGRGRVDVWRGGVGGAYPLAGPFVCRCLTSPAVLRFHTPLGEPDVRYLRIRLSDKSSSLRPRKVTRAGAQGDQTILLVQHLVREACEPLARHLVLDA
jgi:hypothetical protein